MRGSMVTTVIFNIVIYTLITNDILHNLHYLHCKFMTRHEESTIQDWDCVLHRVRKERININQVRRQVRLDHHKEQTNCIMKI
jgi:hypothetical protein